MIDKILRFAFNLLVVLVYSLLFLPVVIIYSRLLTVVLGSIKAGFDFKIWGIEVFLFFLRLKPILAKV